MNQIQSLFEKIIDELVINNKFNDSCLGIRELERLTNALHDYIGFFKPYCDEKYKEQEAFHEEAVRKLFNTPKPMTKEQLEDPTIPYDKELVEMIKTQLDLARYLTRNVDKKKLKKLKRDLSK